MNSHSNTVAEFPHDPRSFDAPPVTEPRPLYWSIRRELWENRSLYIAPLIVTAVVLFASLINTMMLPGKLRRNADPARQQAAVVQPVSMAPAPIMLATIIIGVFYCFDALTSERRDRSILFWKSLPVSDRTIVLSKAAIPIVVLPSIAYALSVMTQLVLLFAANVILIGSGRNPARLLSEFHFFQGLLIMIYGLAVHALWYAPIYGWLLLVSAWARRAALLWAVLPLMAIAAVERIVSGTTSFMAMLQYRVGGAMKEAFIFKTGDGDIRDLSQLDPARFLSRPGLWLGLIFAAACLAGAVRLRRNREPN